MNFPGCCFRKPNRRGILKTLVKNYRSRQAVNWPGARGGTIRRGRRRPVNNSERIVPNFAPGPEMRLHDELSAGPRGRLEFV